MSGSNKYYTLIGSLPALPRHFQQAERVPISLLRLEDRLKMLEPADMEVVEGVFDFMIWDRQRLEVTDEEVTSRYDELMATIRNPLVREMVMFRMTVRTIVSAVRRRRKGLGPPPGVGPWVGHIARNWKHPDFRLAARFPWIVEVEQLLEGDAPMQIERLLLDVTWQAWSRAADLYHFSFEAVILYIARWEIVYRWTSRDAAAGRERFEQLVTEAMGPYAKLYE